MKIIPKLLILTAIALPIGTSAAVAGYRIAKETAKAAPATFKEEGDFYILENDNYKFKLDSYNLSFTVSKGEATWDSGHIDPNDEEITSLREAFLTNPITVYSYNSSGGESNFSIFDSNHASTTTVFRSKVDEAKGTFSMKVTTLDGKRASPNLNLSFVINYTLCDDGLEISVTNIEEKDCANTLSKLAIYPGFGMSYKLNDGYFLLPDGNGALVDLSKPTHGQSAMQLVTYGRDIGISASSRSMTSPYQLSMPMYAICDNEKAMMTTVESGQEYSELNSKVAGMIDEYNATYFRFIFKETTYQYMGISESNRKAVPQEERNDFTPVIHYHLYDEKLAYYDVAKKYQSYLLENSLLNNEKNSSPSLRLEFLMAENKKALFGRETFTMTSTSFIANKMEELMDTGNLFSISLKGYTSGGLGGSYPYSFPASGDYKGLGNKLKEFNVPINYVVDTVRSNEKTHGNKLAMNMSQKLISSGDYVNGTNETFYRVNPLESAKLVKEYDQKVSGYHAQGLDMVSYGNELFSTYHHENNTRSTSITRLATALNDVKGIKNMRQPNLYMFPYFDGYLDTPTSNSGFMMETEAIPFLSMVLSGYKTFYSSPVNLNYLGEKQLLEFVDYNICPSFLLTEKDTTNLIDSPSSSYIYSSVYDVWKEDIINSYQKVINVLKEVSGSAFLTREMVAPNVYKNTYDNGKSIIINYSSNDVDVDGKTVKALSSEVIS